MCYNFDEFRKSANCNVRNREKVPGVECWCGGSALADLSDNWYQERQEWP